MTHKRSSAHLIAISLFMLLILPMARGAVGDSGQLVIRAARVLDVRTGTYIRDAAIYVEGQRIKAVGPAADVVKTLRAAVKAIDLGQATVLPGLIDCHTHLMARFADEPYGYELGLLTKSQAYRALEGAANAR